MLAKYLMFVRGIPHSNARTFDDDTDFRSLLRPAFSSSLLSRPLGFLSKCIEVYILLAGLVRSSE